VEVLETITILYSQAGLDTFAFCPLAVQTIKVRHKAIRQAETHRVPSFIFIFPVIEQYCEHFFGERFQQNQSLSFLAMNFSKVSSRAYFDLIPLELSPFR
jgi:hypothetical protein